MEPTISSIARAAALALGGLLVAATAVAVAGPGINHGPERCPAAGGGIRGAGGDLLVELDDSARLTSRGAALVQGIARHRSSDARYGVVVVDDRDGGDALVIQTDDGLRLLPQTGDVLHPTWSPDGDLVWATGAQIRIYDLATGAVEVIAAPARSIALTNPLFVGRSALIAAIEEPVDSLSSEFEGLDNLWRFDLRDRVWTRLTSFRATAERWSVIRTPLLTPEGDLLFVVVSGNASRTRQPAFDLWRLREDRVERVRLLGSEMYLAGVVDGAVVWNVADARGRWHLLVEDADGSMQDLGCGRVFVDPLTRPDPDVPAMETAGRPTSTPTDAPSPSPSTTSQPTGPIAGASLGILVGDFSTREEAGTMTAIIQTRFGGQAMIVDATTQPTLVRPGVFAVVVGLAEDSDPEFELARFRTLLPQTRITSWVVALS